MHLTMLVTIISILGAVGGFLIEIFSLLKKLIEFIDSVDSVIGHVDELDVKSGNTHNDIYKTLHEHDQHLTSHDEKIKTLFEWKKEHEREIK